MFRTLSAGVRLRLCFPRMRRDVPLRPKTYIGHGRFSPHARGCSRGQSAHKVCALSFPRMRGDVPHGALTKAATQAFSPHARGCSSCVKPQWYKVRVFPACAGMFHCLNPQLPSSFRFPRMRGDVPLAAGATRTVVVFSPHARGCSSGGRRQVGAHQVFPAYAGKFRFRLSCQPI